MTKAGLLHARYIGGVHMLGTHNKARPVTSACYKGQTHMLGTRNKGRPVTRVLQRRHESVSRVTKAGRMMLHILPGHSPELNKSIATLLCNEAL